MRNSLILAVPSSSAIGKLYQGDLMKEYVLHMNDGCSTHEVNFSEEPDEIHSEIEDWCSNDDDLRHVILLCGLGTLLGSMLAMLFCCLCYAATTREPIMRDDDDIDYRLFGGKTWLAIVSGVLLAVVVLTYATIIILGW